VIQKCLEPAARKETKTQITRMVEYGINAGLLEKLPRQNLQRIAINLADARMRDAIIPVNAEIKRLASAVGVNTLIPKAMWKQIAQNG